MTNKLYTEQELRDAKAAAWDEAMFYARGLAFEAINVAVNRNPFDKPVDEVKEATR